jgi:hypothetical protein
MNAADDNQLCAIRVYNFTNNLNASQEVLIRDGIWLTNTFLQLIKTRNCSDFADNNDIGSSTCDLMPYENADTMTLCVCAESHCNPDLETCLNSIGTVQIAPQLPTIMSNVTTIIECANASASDFTCSISSDYIAIINASACEDYVTTHSVLCAIETDNLEQSTQQALIEENYQNYLTGRLHQFKVLRQRTTTDTPVQTDTSIYMTYNVSNVMNEECSCTQNSFCNYNISTCTENIGQTETTISPLAASNIAELDSSTTATNTMVIFTMTDNVTTNLITENTAVTIELTSTMFMTSVTSASVTGTL